MKSKKILSSCLIIVLSTVLVASFAFLFEFFGTIQGNSLIHLPDPPAKAEEIIGIIGSPFYYWTFYVRLVDGQTYSFDSDEDTDNWIIDKPYEEPNDTSCDSRRIRKIEKTSGKIEVCRVASVPGEWCPGPIASLAITADGELWEMKTYRPCELNIAVLSCPLGLIGFIIGMVVVVVINKKRGTKPESAQDQDQTGSEIK